MAYVIGVGMSSFSKPGTTKYIDNGKQAVCEALEDAKLDFSSVDAVVAGSVYTDSASGQRVLHEVGLTGVPVFNVNNNCSTGSSALMLARSLVLSKQYQCVLALGFEQMNEGLDPKYPNKVFPPGVHFDNLNKRDGVQVKSERVHGTDPFTSDVIRLFAHATREYMAKHPHVRLEDFGHIAHKNRTCGTMNPKAALYKVPPPTIPDIVAKRSLVTPITLHMSALTADGAAAALIASDDFIGVNEALRCRAVKIVAQHMRTDSSDTFRSSIQDMTGIKLAQEAAQKCYRYRSIVAPITIHMSAVTADGAAAAHIASDDFVGVNEAMRCRAVKIVAQYMRTDSSDTFRSSIQDMTGIKLAQEAAQKCYREANITPNDIDVFEVHDCFSSNELFMYEALGLAAEGRGCDIIRSGEWVPNQTGGKYFKLNDRWVVNPSGGIESKGHPIGATGLAQCYELVHQLRNEAGPRQVPGAKRALQHNYGIGSAAVVTLYEKLDLNKYHSRL